jgi:hypothetical protein
VHNLQIHEQGSTIRVRDLPSKNFFPTSCLTCEVKKTSTDELHTRTKFLHFLNQAPRSSFKKLIDSMPTLLRGLHTMSIFKSVPEGLKPQDCERIKLRVPPPVPYVPTKDKVQDEVAKLRNLEIKTTIKKDTTLNFPVWHKNRIREAFLMHVPLVLDAIKKRGHFNNYEKAEKDYEEAKKAVESARAALFLLNGTGVKARRSHKKKTKEAEKDATAKASYSESDAKEAKDAPEMNDDPMKAGFLEDLEKAKQAQRTAKGVMTVAASKMFTFYLNLLSPESKYAWNKIVSEQTESDPYVNLQGDSLEGPRGINCKSRFNDCMMFHLLTAFPSTRPSKKSTTSQMYLGIPSASTYASLYGVYSSSTPTLLKCCASTTAHTQMPAPSPRMLRSRRLS